MDLASFNERVMISNCDHARYPGGLPIRLGGDEVCCTVKGERGGPELKSKILRWELEAEREREWELEAERERVWRE